MDHLAILSKQRKLLAKIISGEKTIESRWYTFKKTPYNNISVNDIIYFKESGESVSIKAEVSKVLFFDKLNPEKIKDILMQYSGQISVSLDYADELNGKNFCTLMFLSNVEKVEQFDVDKAGYGLMVAWITIKDIDEIKK